MARLLTVIMFALVMVLLFYFTGIVTSGYFIDTLNILNPEDAVGRNPLAELLPIIALAGGVGGVVAGGVFGRDIRVILYGIATGIVVAIVAGILGDLVLIYGVLSQVSPAIALMVIAPIIILGVFLTIEWILGKD